MSNVTTVITAAGDSRRLFLSAGFGRPKSLVMREGKEVLAHAIEAYSVDPVHTLVTINAEEDGEWGIGARLTQLFPGISVRPVVSGVRGALASALIGLEEASWNDPLVVAAGDSRIDGGIRGFIEVFNDAGFDAATIAFPSTNARWSYLAVDQGGAVRQVAEKKAIGPYATTGVFFFRQASLFLEAATWCLVNNASHNGVFYVSTTLNYLIANGMNVGYEKIDRCRYQSWSLPVDFTEQSQ